MSYSIFFPLLGEDAQLWISAFTLVSARVDAQKFSYLLSGSSGEEGALVV